MRMLAILLRKEMGATFGSPIAYTVAAVFLLVAVVGLGICSVVTLSAGPADPASGTPPSYYGSRQTVYLAVGLVMMLGLT